MALSLNKIVKSQQNALNKNASLFSVETSPTKRLYVEGKKAKLKSTDIIYVLKHFSEVNKIPASLLKTVQLIKRDQAYKNTRFDASTFAAFEKLIIELGVDHYGFFEVQSDQLFKGCGIPHRYALVFSSKMERSSFDTAPSIICQIEVAKAYQSTGHVADIIASFLQENGFGASPNHSMGGQLDYSKAAEKAGFAVTGRHSMAITMTEGPCHRLSVVYTNIENLDAFIKRENEDMLWIKSFCLLCKKCERSCPTHAIVQNANYSEGKNHFDIDYEKCAEGFTHYGCGICIKVCPFTSGNYEKIKLAYMKERAV